MSGIKRNLVLITLIFLLLSGNSVHGNFFNFDPNAVLYNPAVDHVELLNHETFDNVIFNSDRVSIVKFFAHWCGHCHHMAPSNLKILSN